MVLFGERTINATLTFFSQNSSFPFLKYPNKSKVTMLSIEPMEKLQYLHFQSIRSNQHKFLSVVVS